MNAMKRLGLAIVASVLAFAAASVWAQQGSTPGSGYGPGYGYGHMWGGGWGWHPGMIFGPIIMLLILIGIVALIVWLVRLFSPGHGLYPHEGHGRRALDILEERLARGEIGKEEFEEKRKLIGR